MAARVSEPWVAIIYSAIEPAGRRGGGIHNAVIGQAISLMANDVGVRILTASEACAEEAKTRGIDVDLDRAWNSGIDPLVSSRIWRTLRHKNGKRPAAVIHNSGRTWLAGGIMFPGILQTQVMHRETIPPYRFFRNWIALSNPFAEKLKSSASGRFRNIAVAPNGLVDVPTQPAREPRTGPVVFGTAGRLSLEKGTDAFIDAAAQAARLGIDARFKIAGAAPDRYRSYAEQQGVSDILDFVGWTDDMDDFFDSLDVFCLASHKESFGLVLIEAMARGVPVISTTTNGALDIVDAGETGWLVPIDATDELAETFRNVASDRAEITRLGAAAFACVRDRYTPKPVGQALIEALRSQGARL